MLVYITTTEDARCRSVHTTLDEAREYAPKFGATRIFEHDRDNKPAFKSKTDKVLIKNVREISL
jgi:hypothetical protein